MSDPKEETCPVLRSRLDADAVAFGLATGEVVVNVRAARNWIDRNRARLLPLEESMIGGILGILHDVA